MPTLQRHGLTELQSSANTSASLFRIDMCCCLELAIRIFLSVFLLAVTHLPRAQGSVALLHTWSSLFVLLDNSYMEMVLVR